MFSRGECWWWKKFGLVEHLACQLADDLGQQDVFHALDAPCQLLAATSVGSEASSPAVSKRYPSPLTVRIASGAPTAASLRRIRVTAATNGA